MRAAPSLFRGAGKLLTSKYTIGGMVAAQAAPTVLSYADNKTGNVVSRALLDTPVGPALEAALKTMEWANDQPATVVAKNIEAMLLEKGVVRADDPDFERSQKIIEASGHAITGDMIGAAGVLSDLDLAPSDLMAAYNKAKADNPDGSLQEVGQAMFTDIRKSLDSRPSPEQTQAAGAPQERETVQALSITEAGSLSGDKLSEAFNKIVSENNLGMFSSISMFFAKAADFLGFDTVADYFKRAVVVDCLREKFDSAAKGALPEVPQTPEQKQALIHKYGAAAPVPGR
jgi:hypothetical protein